MSDDLIARLRALDVPLLSQPGPFTATRQTIHEAADRIAALEAELAAASARADAAEAQAKTAREDALREAATIADAQMTEYSLWVNGGFVGGVKCPDMIVEYNGFIGAAILDRIENARLADDATAAGAVE